MAYAVVNVVTIKDYEGARASARDEVAPRLQQLPGFAAAIWLADKDANRGMSVILFESREAAEALADRLRTGQTPTPSGIRFERHEVYEVIVQL
jgi:hypothetical protein